MSIEFREGDLVEAVKGENSIRGRLRTVLGTFWVGESGSTVAGLEKLGWEVTLIERATPKVELPTEPGYYADNAGDAWLLKADGVWVNLDAYQSGERMLTGSSDKFVPFTRLESRADTARAVMDAFTDAFTPELGWYWLEHLTAIREQFGVAE